MGRGAFAAALVGWGLLACGPSIEVTRIELPVASVPEAGSMILAFRAEQEARRLSLIDLGDLGQGGVELPVVRDHAADIAVEIDLLFYRGRPSDLGLEPGRLEAQSVGGTALRFFSAERFVKGLSLRRGVAEDERWQTRSQLSEFSEATLATRVTSPPCVSWRPTNAKVSACRHPVLALRAGPDRVYFGTAGQRFWELDLSNPSRPAPVPAASPLPIPLRPPATDAQCAEEGTASTSTAAVPMEQRVYGAVGRRDGHAWYGGWASVHYVKEGGAPLTVPLPMPPGTVFQRGVRWLEGQVDPEAPDFELYAMTSLGAVFRVTRGAQGFEAALIYEFGVPDASDISVYGGLAYPGPGRVVAVQGADDRVLYYDHRRPEAERVHDRSRPLPGQGYSAALYVPELGSLIAGEGARIFRHAPDTNDWLPLEVTRDWQSRIEALGRFRDGFIFGGTNGFMAQYAIGPGFCATRQLAPHTPRDIIELESVVFAIGAKPADRNDAVFAVLEYD